MTKNFSTFAIARMLQVDPGSVANWIDQGLLKAYRTPGRHRRVTDENLLDFVRAHGMPIPPELEKKSDKILIVDDEPAVTQLIARAISSSHEDCEVIVAHDGFEVGRIVATQKPRVVVLDLRMPGMDGFEVCRRIKSDEGSRDTEVIAITAYPSQENMDRILECGARTCLTKPLDLEKLVEQVNTCLG